jgi:hypothetical protein
MFIIKEGTPADKIGEGTDPQTEQAIQQFLTKKGYVLRTTDQEKSFLETHTQQQIDAAFSQRNTQLEQDIESLTGIKRNSNEKHYDFLKRAVSSRLTEVNDLKAKIADWEKKGGAGSETIINDLKNQLASAQQTYQQALSEKETALNELNKKFFGTQLNSTWDQSLSKLRPMFTESPLIDDAVDARRRRFFDEHEAIESNGQIVFKKKSDGKILISTADGKPKSADEIVKELYKDLIDKKRQQGGSGSSGGGTPPPGDGGAQPPADWKQIQIPIDKIKNGVQLHEYMRTELKMDERTKEFGEAYKHWMTTHKLKMR